MSDKDYLKIKNDKNVKKMLTKVGDNYPTPELVQLSTKLLKINRKGKEQKRVLMVTNKAIYNIKPNKLGSCQRRIMLGTVASITESIKSQEFTINVPTEYDYRYKATDSSQKNDIIATLCQLYGKLTGLNLNVHKISQTSTEEHTVTKVAAKLIVGVILHLIYIFSSQISHILHVHTWPYCPCKVYNLSIFIITTQKKITLYRHKKINIGEE